MSESDRSLRQEAEPAGHERAMSLPFDYARCQGTTAPLCQWCRRREPGHPTWQSYISPEWQTNGCPNFIEPIQTIRAASVSSRSAGSDEQGGS